MVELFQDISKQVKKRAEFWVDIAFLNPNPRAGAQELLNYRNSLKNEREKEYLDFYLALRALEKENKINEDYSNRE